EDLAMREQEQKTNLINHAVLAVSDYAKKEKIDIVISAEQVVYQNTTKDITANVIKAVAPTKDLTKDKQK
ncbi:hypothetical protein EBS02_02270, partial [bacterium]|nr:hypothetical protein [bacterium]